MCIVHNPCLHGALCVNVDEGKVECKCRARFTGDRCEGKFLLIENAGKSHEHKNSNNRNIFNNTAHV